MGNKSSSWKTHIQARIFEPTELTRVVQAYYAQSQSTERKYRNVDESAPTIVPADCGFVLHFTSENNGPAIESINEHNVQLWSSTKLIDADEPKDFTVEKSSWTRTPVTS